jgi:tRNA G46 methylase TrmB
MVKNEQIPMSNRDINWAKHYDYYEIELREMYRGLSKPQNDSHYEMVKKNFKSHLNNEKVFAEIGFSAGLTLRNFSPHFKELYGLDISPKNVEFTKSELSREGFSNIHLYPLDILKCDERF